MKRERRSRALRSPLITNDCSDSSSHPGRDAPALVVELPLEGKARVYMRAASFEDEMRLRGWLRVALRRRPSLATELADWLDYLNEREAA